MGNGIHGTTDYGPRPTTGGGGGGGDVTLAGNNAFTGDNTFTALAGLTGSGTDGLGGSGGWVVKPEGITRYWQGAGDTLRLFHAGESALGSGGIILQYGGTASPGTGAGMFMLQNSHGFALNGFVNGTRTLAGLDFHDEAITATGAWTFSGAGTSVSVPTVATADNSTKAASTAFVKAAIAAGGALLATSDTTITGAWGFANDVLLANGKGIGNAAAKWVFDAGSPRLNVFGVGDAIAVTAAGDLLLGVGATATGATDFIVVGAGAAVTGFRSTAVGFAATAAGYATAFGAQAGASGGHGVAVGYNAGAGSDSVAVGSLASASAGLGQSVVVGASATASGDGSVALGFNAFTFSGSTGGVAIGAGAKVGVVSGSSGGIAIGSGAEVSGVGGLAIGQSAYSMYDGRIEIANSTATARITGQATGEMQLTLRQSDTANTSYSSAFGGVDGTLAVGTYTARLNAAGTQLVFSVNVGGTIKSGTVALT